MSKREITHSGINIAICPLPWGDFCAKIIFHEKQSNPYHYPSPCVAFAVVSKANARDLPWRNTREPYHIWLSEVMLQQTRVEAMRSYYARFLGALPTIAALAAAPQEQLMKLWEGLGYYNRTRNLQRAAVADSPRCYFCHL